ncbi:MAG: hypothetical protein ABSA93_16500 [Streptosporangiaceae bacterium]|jgi:hypothetical protein
MDHTCDSAAERIAERLGFSCRGANPVVTFRNPFHLENGTMPVLELLIIAGAVFAFVHAWRRWRRDGDPVNISLWFASVVYLMVTEPPLYFPEWFGLEKYVGFIFMHNVFTVQFMFDRLPLYIVAFYPAISQLAYELARTLRVFERRGILAGSLAVAFACQVFYEIFDQLGPQLKWWAWNPANKVVNQPMFASVPMNSMVLFASVSFGAMTYLVVRLVGARGSRGTLRGRQIAWRTFVAGALTPLAMMIVSVPSGLFVENGSDIDVRRTILGVELALIWIVGLYLLFDAARAVRNQDEATATTSPMFVRTYPAAYLVVLVALWLVALPAFLGAIGGITKDGTPIGSWWYVIACVVVSSGFITLALRATRPRPTAEAVGT